MSTRTTRNQQRLHLLALFIRELLSMPDETIRTLAEWSVSVGILLLIFEEQMSGTVGAMAVTFIMTVDVVRAYRIYKQAQLGQVDALTSDE